MSSLSKILLALVVIAVVPCGMVWVAKTVVMQSYTVNYGLEDGHDVYRQIFGSAPPAGVKEIKAYGHGGPSATSVWLRIAASNEGLQRLHASAMWVAPGDFHFQMPGGVGNINTVLLDDARAAGWDQIPTIAKPQYYYFLHHTSDGRWFGDIVIDPAGHEAFIRAQLFQKASTS